MQDFYGIDALYFKRCEYGSISGLFLSAPPAPCVYLKFRKSFPLNTLVLLTEKKASEEADGFLGYKADALSCALRLDQIRAIENRLESIYQERITDSPLCSCFTFVEHELLTFLFPGSDGPDLTMAFESATLKKY